MFVVVVVVFIKHGIDFCFYQSIEEILKSSLVVIVLSLLDIFPWLFGYLSQKKKKKHQDSCVSILSPFWHQNSQHWPLLWFWLFVNSWVWLCPSCTSGIRSLSTIGWARSWFSPEHWSSLRFHNVCWLHQLKAKPRTRRRRNNERHGMLVLILLVLIFFIIIQ